MTAEKKHDLGKVLVIGGCGFLGHHVVDLLLRDYKCSVSVIDLRCERNRRPDSDGVSYHDADITDAPKLASVFDSIRPDVVIHTASPAVHGANTGIANDLFRKVNVDGTRAVIDACEKTAVKALVYTSSASVISDNKSDLVNADERWPPVRGADQSEYYSETKAAAEELVLLANRTGSPPLLTASIRPSGIIGEGDAQSVYHMINIYKQGRTNIQVGSNENLFDFTYAQNVAHAHLLAARALLHTRAASTGAAPLDTEKVDGEAFLITNDTPIYFWDFCRAVWAAAGSPLATDHVWVLPRDVGLALGYLSECFFAVIGKPPTFNRQRIVYSCMTRYYNITKAKRRLGYVPLVPLDVGIKQSVAWFLEQEKAGK